ncbi:hypothetical protein [Pseudoalteromonas sp. MMG005]|nr:hypothetical protein [Pseudoalteromonas sp. MMG005]MBQ4844723.1 hypothetical protein [Pseudoalteromonas sp. MMG005]
MKALSIEQCKVIAGGGIPFKPQAAPSIIIKVNTCPAHSLSIVNKKVKP